MNTLQNFHFKVGDLDCIAINDGVEIVPLESVFKEAPAEELKQALVERGYSSAESTVFFNVLFIYTGRHRLLIDAGWGKGVQRRDGALVECLQAEGITPADIDGIVITHGDVDHIGGILDKQDGLVFSKAEYILPKDAWDFWNNAPLIARWPEFLTVFGRKVLPHIRSRVRVAEMGTEFLPGFWLLPAPGHRPGHCAIGITSNGEHLIHLADTVGHPLLMERPAWMWYADFQPGQAQNDKTQVLNQAADLNALVFGSHLPFPGIGRVTRWSEGWVWRPEV